MNAPFAPPAAGTLTAADLVLIRYALPKPTPKKVRDDVGKLLGAEPTAAEFDDTRAALASAGLLAKGQRNTFALTDAGRQRTLDLLGVSALPPKTTWDDIIGEHLFPRAVGLSQEAAAELGDADKLGPFILKRKYKLSGNAGTTVNQLLEALVCRELGFPEETTLKGLLEAKLSNLIPTGKRYTKRQLAHQLPRFETELAKANAKEARHAFVRNWLAGPTTTSSPEPPRQTEPFDLAAFAATVRSLAAGSPAADRFYGNKVFIAPLWRASQAEPNFPRLTLAQFKERLIEANARHLLHLSRADLVQAMDPELVLESEAAYLNATFHFVLLEEPRS